MIFLIEEKHTKKSGTLNQSSLMIPEIPVFEDSQVCCRRGVVLWLGGGVTFIFITRTDRLAGWGIITVINY
jgi:hypothetical protein